MVHFKKRTWLTILLALATSSNCFANTILDSSISWNNQDAKTQLLTNVPKWEYSTINSVFNVYSHPEKYLLPLNKDEIKYNIQFLNAFWGPLENPFTKFQRPAKAFVFLNQQGPNPMYFMAPIIQSSSDGNYYVFANNQKQPELLNDWINDIRIRYHTTPFFNICAAYGNYPNDSCSNQSYQDEAYAAVNQNDLLKSKNIPSAHRNLNEDWKTTLLVKNLRASNNGSILNNSVSWNDETARKKLTNTISTWSSYKIIKANFEKIRDLRYFADESNLSFARRITWLYPDDGCWTRATAMIKDFFGPLNNPINDLNRPSKIFAFGNLCVNTDNSPDGYVSWWYHTAPIVKDAETNQDYVLDPSIDPYAPMLLDKWIKAITSQTGACQSANNIDTFNICNGHGTNPREKCNGMSFSTETKSMLSQSYFRTAERNRQFELHRDADKVLGNQPPWANS